MKSAYNTNNFLSYENWLKESVGLLDRTAKRYTRALEKSEEWLGIILNKKILNIISLSEFNDAEKQIKNTENFSEINQNHGHGDLSAALRAYRDYLEYLNSPHNEEHWFPIIEEYNPGISKEKWLEILNNDSITYSNNLEALACMYDYGGQGSCSEIEDKYGIPMAQIRTSLGVSFAERVSKYTGCPLGTEVNSKYWIVLFVGRKTDEPDKGSYIWKMRSELYEALTEFDIRKYLPIHMTTKEAIEKISEYIAAKGFTYGEGLIENFYLSLKSKPFVILAGTSGTGKTRLVRLFAEAVGATGKNGRYKLVSVRPDWSDSSDLLGYNDLEGKFIKGEVLDFIMKASKDLTNPYFLCLDEMNLARVEYYFSDFLSIMETREWDNGRIVTDPIIKAEKIGKTSEDIGNVGLPENLYIIGTVNMDETTFPFSKKVLDRANTIEFSDVNFVYGSDENGVESYFPITAEEKAVTIELKNCDLRSDCLSMIDIKDANEKAFLTTYCKQLEEINSVLKPINSHVGYRTRDELIFYMLYNFREGLLDNEVAFDSVIMQKILPRIQGSSAEIKKALEELNKKLEKYKADKCCEKITFMIKRFDEDGFTSFWL